MIVLSSLNLMTLAGLPATIAFAGTSLTTTDPAPIIALSPMWTLPTQITQAPKSTLSPITGCSSNLSGLFTPTTDNWRKVQLAPMDFALILVPKACSRNRPAAILF
ncbi:hypothetical protein C1I88_11735 [Akkermansia muciniphila]|nr:hypothetical protein C1I88_11735 [Akkermansia muciniphila]